MKLKDLIFENVPEQFEKQVAPTAAGINKVIDSIDDSMHYGVFAKAIAKVFKDEYGSHNIKPFMDVLHAELGINENIADNSHVVYLEDLDWDMVQGVFQGIGPGYSGVRFPFPSDESLMVGREDSLELWKDTIKKRYGNVKVELDPNASEPWNKVKVLDGKFQADKKGSVAAKGAWLDKEREAGRSTD